MAADNADSSQVGLFSAQISEQIARLRALGSPGSATSNPETNLRRAIMATRLLAGSSRILRFVELQGFLDLLLDWLQALETGPRDLNTTQTLLLESVIDLEEQLMRQFDAGGEGAKDLSPRESEIQDLQTLIQRNLEEMRRRPATIPTPPAEDLPPSPPAQDERPESRGDPAAAASAALEAAVRRLRTVMGSETSPGSLEILRDALGAQLRELQIIEEELRRRAQAQRAPSQPADPDLGPPLPHPEEDPVYAQAFARLEQAAQDAGTRLVFRAHGSARGADPAIQNLARDLFEALAGDVADEIAAQSIERPVHVTASLRAEQGHLTGWLGDDLDEDEGPRNPLDLDHLAVMPGLRRARALLTHHDGLLRANPVEGSQRFRFTLPLSTDHPRYAVLRRGEESVALSASLLEDVLHAPPLEIDPDGQQSLMHQGRAVAVVDLAALSAAATFQSDPGEHVALFGFVEKRLAMFCDGSIELHSAAGLLDPPPEWEGLAYGALEIEGQTIAVMDVRALLGRRYRSEGPGGPPPPPPAAEEPGVDSYVPVPERPRIRLQRALVVNQSEFRRRELTRTLQGQGLSVQAVVDMDEGREILESEDIEILLSDLRLGASDAGGFHGLREDFPGLRVVLTTSVAADFAEELREKAGADACWREPFHASEFRQILADLTN